MNTELFELATGLARAQVNADVRADSDPLRHGFIAEFANGNDAVLCARAMTAARGHSYVVTAGLNLPFALRRLEDTVSISQTHEMKRV